VQTIRPGAAYSGLMAIHGPDGVLITGVYGTGKSSVAAEIAYVLEQRRQPYALLDLDYLGWGGDNFDDHEAGFGLMLRNVAAVVSNYRDAGVSVFVAAYFVRHHNALRGIREAVGVPLRVVRLTVPLPEIEQRLAADLTTERREDLREAAASIAAGEGAGVEDVVVANDRPPGDVAHEIMAWLDWL
jgi:adenylylsulfate kinase-like enzyme